MNQSSRPATPLANIRVFWQGGAGHFVNGPRGAGGDAEAANTIVETA